MVYRCGEGIFLPQDLGWFEFPWIEKAMPTKKFRG
jgi:hypothetical protein